MVSVYDEVVRSREEIRYIEIEIASIQSYYSHRLQQVRHALACLQQENATGFFEESYSNIKPSAAIALLLRAQQTLERQAASVIEAIHFMNNVSLSFPPLEEESTVSGCNS